MNRALEARAALCDLYERGEYVGLQTSGTSREHVFAFARRTNGDMSVTCVPRLVASWSANGTPPIGDAVWADTRVHLPPARATTTFRHAFTGATVVPQAAGDGFTIPAAALFEDFPVALLVRDRR